MGQNTINSRLGKDDCESECEDFLCPRVSCGEPCFIGYDFSAALSGMEDGDIPFDCGCDTWNGELYEEAILWPWLTAESCCWTHWTSYDNIDIYNPCDQLGALHTRFWVGKYGAGVHDWAINFQLFSSRLFSADTSVLPLPLFSHVYSLTGEDAYNALLAFCEGECYELPYIGDISGLAKHLITATGCSIPHEDIDGQIEEDATCDANTSVITICPGDLLPERCVDDVLVEFTSTGDGCDDWDVEVTFPEGCDCDTEWLDSELPYFCLGVVCADAPDVVRRFCTEVDDACTLNCCDCVEGAVALRLTLQGTTACTSGPTFGDSYEFFDWLGEFTAFILADGDAPSFCHIERDIQIGSEAATTSDINELGYVWAHVTGSSPEALCGVGNSWYDIVERITAEITCNNTGGDPPEYEAVVQVTLSLARYCYDGSVYTRVDTHTLILSATIEDGSAACSGIVFSHELTADQVATHAQWFTDCFPITLTGFLSLIRVPPT